MGHPLRSALLLGALIGLACFPRTQEREESPWEDPAPPQVNELPAHEASEPAVYPELLRVSEPRPLAEGARVEDWPAFLGPRRDAHSSETHLDLSFGSDGPRLLWRAESGEGWASPIVVDGILVHTHRVGREIHVDGLEPETGLRRWRFSYPTSYRPRYVSDSGPRATPAAAEGRVVLYGPSQELYCLELVSGRVLWQRDLAAEFGALEDFFGAVCSPLIHEGRVYLNMGTPGPCVAAFDLESGRLLWGGGPDWGPSCASPALANLAGRETLLVVAGGESRPPTGGLVGLDPRTGEQLFTHPFRSRTYESVNGATPLAIGDSVLITASYNTGTSLVDIDAEAGLTRRWHDRHVGFEFATPLLHEGLVYAVDGVRERSSELVCIDPADGEERWRQDVFFTETIEVGGQEREHDFALGSGTLMWAGERLIALGDYGHLAVYALGDEGAELESVAWLFSAVQTWTPPVLSHGLLYVRQIKPARYHDAQPALYCYDLRAQ